MKQIKHILVPIDFSEISERLVKTAVSFAQLYKAELTIIFVVQDAASYTGSSMPGASFEQLEDSLLDYSKKRMADYLERCLADSPVPFQGKVLQGDVADEIINFSGDENNNVGLIVMGTHGRKGFKKMLMGSVIDKVLKDGPPCPVLSIR